MNLEGKVAIVTDGAFGIGRATSLLLAKRGVKVVIHYSTNDSLAEAVVSDIQTDGGEAIALQADIRSMDQVIELVATAISFGQLDILVCNTNSYFEAKAFEDMTWDEFSQKLNDELKAAFISTKAVIPSMIRQQCGRIIYISNTHGKDPSPQMIALGTAKGGLDTFSMYIAQEFGPQGICANVVIAFLTSDDARFVTGTYTPVTGGLTME